MPIPFDKAIIDRTGKYRYLLSRHWAGSGHGRLCFIMLNPSTADAEKDDATIRSCLRIAKKIAGSFSVVNLFAFRATQQSDLILALDPIGPENDKYIIEAASDADLVIAAWGVEKAAYKARAAAVRRLLRKNGIELSCLAITKDGYPKHPLFLKGSTEPIPYKRRVR